MRSRQLGTEFTPAESARLASMELRAEEPEALRERVAAALCDSDSDEGGLSWDRLRQVMPRTAATYLRYADAAIAAICTPVEQP